MKTDVKSKIWEAGFFKGEHLESFRDDINNLKEIKTSELRKIIDFVKKIIVTESEKEEYELINKAVDLKIVDNHSIILSFYGVIRYFLKKFNDEKNKVDTPEVIVQDICNELDYKQEELKSIIKFLELIKEESAWYDKYKLTKSTSLGLLPYLKGIGTTVELRGVYNREIDFGEKVEDYKKSSKIYSDNPIVPVITIALSLDSGTPNRFCFQSSPQRIVWLIEELKAAIYKLELLEKSYKK